MECAWGLLSRDTTVPAGRTITVLSDLWVPSTRTLTLSAGVALKFDDHDNTSDGNDPDRNDLMVEGSLIANGSSQQPVQFVSSRLSPDEGDWFGIDARDATSLALSAAEVKHSIFGLMPKTDSGTNTISECRFSDNGSYDIYCVQLGQSAPIVSSCQIDVGGGTGLYLNGDFSDGVFQENVIEGDGATSHGLYLNAGAPLFSENTISGASMGDGVRIVGGSPEFELNSVSGNSNGFRVTGGTPQIGDDPRNENFITENLIGVYSAASGCTFGPVHVRGT